MPLDSLEPYTNAQSWQIGEQWKLARIRKVNRTKVPFASGNLYGLNTQSPVKANCLRAISHSLWRHRGAHHVVSLQTVRWFNLAIVVIRRIGKCCPPLGNLPLRSLIIFRFRIRSLSVLLNSNSSRFFEPDALLMDFLKRWTPKPME